MQRVRDSCCGVGQLLLSPSLCVKDLFIVLIGNVLRFKGAFVACYRDFLETENGIGLSTEGAGFQLNNQALDLYTFTLPTFTWASDETHMGSLWAPCGQLFLSMPELCPRKIQEEESLWKGTDCQSRLPTGWLETNTCYPAHIR